MEIGIKEYDELEKEKKQNLDSMNIITKEIFELQEQRDLINKEINKKIKNLEKNYTLLLSSNIEIESELLKTEKEYHFIK